MIWWYQLGGAATAISNTKIKRIMILVAAGIVPCCRRS
ncbi:hypothetical protein R2A130_2770 [Ahrensia sp. R2A130]|nr:hypothetical protein R2A130_2770 [Ahrensia sp. R2A130]